MKTGVGGVDRPAVALLVAEGGKAEVLIPPLHEPIMTMVGAEGFVLRGIERVDLQDGVYGVVQEWRCEVMLR